MSVTYYGSAADLDLRDRCKAIIGRVKAQRVDRAEVVAMLTAAAAGYGLTVDQVSTEWANGTLDWPRLRDLWLIWGPVLEGEDDTAEGGKAE